jgi:NAD-dependent dihydropyrimidine dehydrogenase PreA subunit
VDLKYMRNGETLELDEGACVGCGACLDVCPHAVFRLESGKAAIARRWSCMECGACARNCPASAISVKVGVGCAAAIIRGKLTGTAPSCGEGACCGSGGKGSSCC